MKKAISLSVLFAFATMTFAQSDREDYYKSSKSKLLSKDRVSASMTMGAGIGFLNATKNSTFTNFIAPQIGYQLTPDFKLNFGLMHYSMTGNTLMSLTPNEGFINTSGSTVSGNLLFAGGEYNLNKRLILSGSMIVDANNFNSNKKDNYKAATIGLEYKTSTNSSIKFETTISQGKGNYYNTPTSFPTPGFNSFGTGFSNGMNTSPFR